MYISRNQAFSLFEVIIAMMVFSIIAVAVFGVIDVAMSATNELQTSQRTNRQVSGFIELCRQTFASLPQQASLRSGPVEENAPNGQEIVFSNAPLIFSWGGSALNYGSATIGVRSQEDGNFSLAISRSDFVPPDDGDTGVTTVTDTTLEPDEQGRYWLVLMPDLQWVQWRFFDPQIDDWADFWVRGSRPRIIELQFLLAGDTVPIRAVFPVSAATQPPRTR